MDGQLASAIAQLPSFEKVSRSSSAVSAVVRLAIFRPKSTYIVDLQACLAFMEQADRLREAQRVTHVMSEVSVSRDLSMNY